MENTILRALVEDAVRAPSSHNTQPWLFRVADEQIELLADRTRALPVNDPYDRELAISCGAALFNLRASASAHGLATDVELCPDGDEDLLARIRLGRGTVDSAIAPLLEAMASRHTTRDSFLAAPLPGGFADQLAAAADQEGATLRVIEGEHRQQLASLVDEGDRAQFGDPSWRRELASWMHTRRKGDGLAVPAALAPISRLVVRHFDLGSRTGASDEKLATQAPMLAVLTSERDETVDWLRSGQALQRVLLVAAAQGFAAGYLNQPCQVERLRPRLSELVGAVPQVVVRLGRLADAPKPSVRRPVDEVLESRDAVP